MIDELKRSITDNNIDEALRIIEIIGNEKNELALPVLLEIFETTGNNILRNQIALALSDIGNPIVVEPIIKMISNPKIQKSRGTLIYSLKSLECTQHIKLFVKLLLDRNFEVSREAFSLIESNYVNVSNSDKQECINLIEEELEILNDRLDLLNEAYELLSDDKDIEV